MQCFAINPKTLDIDFDGKGAIMTQRTAATALICQYSIAFQRWPISPRAGSKFFNLALFQNAPVQLVAAEARRCSEFLVRAGIIDNVTVEAAQKGTQLLLQTQCRDTGSGQPIDLNTGVRL